MVSRVTSAQVVVLRRTWPQRLLIAVNLAVISMLLFASAGLGYFYWRFGQLPTIGFGFGVLAEASGPAFNVLVVGSDSRADLTGEDAASKGDTSVVGGQRSDTIIVVRVDPDNRSAKMLSIPRDLLVPIAGTSREDRINAAFADGPEALIRTVNEFFGITINHYAEVDFNGFRGVVKAVGGVDVYFPGPARDSLAELDVPNGGCIELSGDQALAYVRSRHYEYFESGRWRSDLTSDIGRIGRQQDFIRRLMRRVATGLPLNPLRLNDLVKAGIDNVVIDDQMSFDQIVSLARRFRSLDPDAIEMLTLPVRNHTTSRGAAVLLLQRDDAEPILEKFRDQVPEGPAVPGSTTVRVLNGTGVSDQANRTNAALQVVGFNAVKPGDADRFVYDVTTIRFGRGQQDKAELLRSHLLGGAVLIDDPDLTAVDVVLITGADFVGVTEQRVDHGPPHITLSGEPAPATTAPPPTTPPTTVPGSPTTEAPATEASGADPALSC